MNPLIEERIKLENQENSFQKKIFSFSKKNKRIGELKLSFFEKLKKAQEKENLNQIKIYADALIRATNLSEQIYKNILINLEKESIFLNQETSNEEIEDFFLQYRIVKLKIEEETGNKQNFPINEFKNSFKIKNKELTEYICQIQSKIKFILNKEISPIFKILNKINEERQLLESLIIREEDFFTKNLEEIEIHKLLNEELLIEEEINKLIQNLLKVSESFVKENALSIQENKTLLEKLLIELEKDYEISKKYSNIPFEKLLEKGELLEKHASKFALTVVFLSGIASISTLLGLGIVASIFGAAFGIVATGGEMLQSLPFVKRKILPKLDLAITNLFQNGVKAKINLLNNNKIN